MLMEDVTSWCTVAVFNFVMETDFIQCQPKTTKWKKKGKQPGSDAAYCYILVSSACKCVIVLSGYIVYILYLDRTGCLQSRDYSNIQSKTRLPGSQ